MIKRTCAVVVAYNRAAMLQSTLDALRRQTLPLDAIIVIDNASTDETSAVCESYGRDVTYFNTGSNLGGAGGFAWGIEIAIALGYSHAWLMDDDAVPFEDSFQSLVRGADAAASTWGRYPAVAASTPTRRNRDGAGVPGSPAVVPSLASHLDLLEHGVFRITSAAFLGVMIDLSVARTTHLPHLDYFIWCDDLEYTHRLIGLGGGVCVAGSHIFHDSPSMEARTSSTALGWKAFYEVRNRLWLATQRDSSFSPSERVAHLGAAVRATRNELRFTADRPAEVRTLSTAWAKGLATRPRRQLPGDLIRASENARRWLSDER